MHMTKIKTITFLMKCLRVDIPIFKEIYGVAVQTNALMLYKTSLIELIKLVNVGELFIKITKEHAESLVKAADAAEKLRIAAEETRVKTPAASKASKPAENSGEPEFELIPPDPVVEDAIASCAGI